MGMPTRKLALDAYRVMKENQHLNFHMVDCGFFISTDYPFIGVSPDSLISCDCCGEGCVEVNCPYCKRNDTVDEASKSELKSLNHPPILCPNSNTDECLQQKSL